MNNEEDIARDQYCIAMSLNAMSLKHDEEIRKEARRLFEIDPDHAIALLLHLVDELMKKSGVDLNKDLGNIAMKYDKQMKKVKK